MGLRPAGICQEEGVEAEAEAEVEVEEGEGEGPRLTTNHGNGKWSFDDLSALSKYGMGRNKILHRPYFSSILTYFYRYGLFLACLSFFAHTFRAEISLFPPM